MGDGNVSDSEFHDPHRASGDLKEAITSNPDLDESQKLNFAVYVESSRDRPAKPEPGRRVIRHLRGALENLATIEGLAAAAARIHRLLSPLLL